MIAKRIRIITILSLLFTPLPALAYLDPGTGSALIQGLIAAIAAIGVSIKLFWHRLVALFSGRKNEETVSPETRDNDPDAA